MGAFKTFDARDVILTPFTVNKGFSFYGDSEFTGSGLRNYNMKYRPFFFNTFDEKFATLLKSLKSYKAK